MHQPLGTAAVTMPDVAASEKFAARLAASLPQDVDGWLICLQGDLGAGKSTIARAMLHAMGYQGVVPSPTYTLVEPYEINGKIIYHVDLYRIADEDELEYLGWSDMQDGLMLVEWPERVPHLVHNADALIRLRYAGEGREATLEALTPRAREALLQAGGAAD